MNIQRKDQYSVLTIDRDLIYNHFSDILNTVGTLIKEKQPLIVLDMTPVEYVSAKGIDLILDLAERIRGTGREVRITGLSAPLRRLFDLTGLSKVIEIMPSADASTSGGVDGVSEVERNIIRDLF